MTLFRTALIAVLLAALSACSPYGFAPEVTQLNTNVQNMDTSVTNGHSVLSDDRTASYRRALIANRSAVGLALSCDKPMEVARYVPTGKPEPKAADDKVAAPPPASPRQPCDVYLASDIGHPQSPPFPIPDKVTAEIKALSAYMGGLAAVTNSTDRTNYNAAVKTLSASVTTLVSTAGGAPAGAIAGAGINLVGWMLGNALDIQRFETLKEAVNTVQPADPSKFRAFDTIVNSLGLHSDNVVEFRREALNTELRNLRRTLGPGLSEETYRARLADIETMAAVVDAMNQSSGQAAANGLIQAHEKLVQAVNAYEPNLNDLITALGTLKDQVTALQTALTAASAPAPAAKAATAAK